MLGVVCERVAAIAVRRSGAVLVAAAVIAVLSLGAATRLRLNPDIVAFLPNDNRAVADFRRLVTAFGTLDHHVVLITVPRGAEGDSYEPLVDAVVAEYEKFPAAGTVMSRLPDPQSIVAALLPHFLLLVTPQELESIAARLSDDAIREAMAENRMLLQTPQSTAVETLVKLDPLKLRSVLLQRVQNLGGGMRLDPTSRHLRSADRSTYLIVLRPTRPAQDLPFANELMERSREIERRAVQEFVRASPGVALPQFQYAGGYAVTHADAQLIRADMIANVLFSFFGVLLLFVFAFRRFAAILYAAIPMLLAILATFGLAALVLGELGAASAGFAALLAGLGIDFTTILYGRFIEERNRGAAVETALQDTLRSTLPGVIVAALTTAATFYGFLFTDFRGMRQMGFLTGTGILLFLVAVAFVFPALAVRFERGVARRASLHVPGAERLVRWSLLRPRATIAGWIVFVIVMSVAAGKLEFSDDAGRLRARGNAGIVASERLTALFGRGGDPVMIVAEGRTADEAQHAMQQVVSGLQRLARRGEIAGFETAASLLPSRERQEATIAALRNRHDSAFDGERVTQTFRRAAIENGFRPGIWEDYLERFTAGLSPARPLTLDAIEEPWLQQLSERFLKQSGAQWMSVAYVHPPNGRWRDGVPPELQALASAQKGVTVTGITVVSAELRRITRADALRATLIGTAIILTILLLAFRSLTRVVLIFVPFLAGGIGMLGAMALLGLEFNLMNIFVGLMIVGVATDYAVYMMQRYLESPGELALLAPETGKAVTMAAATAVVGYGSFALSHYPGLQSLGYASTFGITLTCLASITLLPAIFAKLASPGTPRP